MAAVLLVPRFALFLERALAGFSRLRPANAGGGVFLGITLGLVFVPCAGPFLAAITAAAASENFGARAIVATIAYAVGAGVPMLAIAYGGREAAGRIRAGGAGTRRIRRSRGGRRGRPRPPSGRPPDEPARAGAHGPREPSREQRRPAKQLAKVRGGRAALAAVQNVGAGPARLRSRAAATSGRRLDQQQAADDRGAARQSGARRLLDVLVHQLPPHTAAPEDVVRDLPLEGARDHRRAHARVRIRARHVECPRRGEATRGQVPGGAGQPLQDLGHLRQPVLAGGVPDRPRRPDSAHAFRRGRVRADRAADPPPAERQGAEGARGRRHDTERAAHARDVPRVGAHFQLHRLDRSFPDGS